MKSYEAIIIGATGATGTAILSKLIKDNDFKKIVVFTRKPPLINNEKLVVNIVDFDQIDSWKSEIKGDVLFSAMGTTLKDAGSKDDQYKVDFTYQFSIAKAASENNVKKLFLVSSVGANYQSNFFYPRIKGELEKAVKELDFEHLSIFQPPVLVRQNDKIRSGEKVLIKVFKAFNMFGLLLSQKPMEVDILANKMISTSKKESQQKQNTYLPKDIFS